MSVQDAAAVVAALARRAVPSLPPFEPLQAQDHGSVVAIDGSHAVLCDNGAVWAAAIRVAAARWPDGSALPPGVEYHATTPDEAPQVIAEAYGKHGLEPPRIHGAESFAESVRSLREHEEALRADADLILVDGALRGLPAGAQAMADRLLARSEVVAVAKRSGLARGGVPLVPVLAKAGPPEPWIAAVDEGVWVARLHGRSPFAFRVDAPTAEDVGRLVGLAKDAVYLGYPYPLAVAHNAAAITGAERMRMRTDLRDAVAQAGGDVGVLADFHDVLDRNVPR